MKASVNIHPPKNWQDFETLCLRLWGEIWKVPHEIEFNSDNAQGQNGVDIFAPIDDGLNYNGIQCKNKKLNLINGSPNRILIKDIQAEIDEAKSFIPRLNKLVIATSLSKDRKVEEYVRLQSVENVKNGLFSIQICFWEFFERKLIEFPTTFNWYVKNEDFQRVKNVKVTFNDGNAEATRNPKFQKTVKNYVKKSGNELEDNLESTLSKYLFKKMTVADILKQDNIRISSELTIPWEQNCWFKIQISNIGETVLENYKLELKFDGEFKEVGAECGHFLNNPNFLNTVKEYSNSKKSLYIKPKESSLVQNDYFISGSFYVKPLISENSKDIKVHWKLLSKDFTDEGTLIIKIVPKFYKVNLKIEIKDDDVEKVETSYKLIDRRGMRQIGGINYFDKISDYDFED